MTFGLTLPKMAGNCQMFDWLCTCDTEFSSYDSWIHRNVHAKLTKTEQELIMVGLYGADV